jgi:hypothetical protein
VSQNLVESGYIITYDNRFIISVLAASPGSYLNNNGTLGVAQAATTLKPMSGGGANKASAWSNRAGATIPALANNIVHRPNDTTVDTATSIILGPRSSWTCFNLIMKDLTTEDYNRFGKTAQNLLSDGNTYNYIDTEIEIYGATTGAGDIVAVRLIKKV